MTFSQAQLAVLAYMFIGAFVVSAFLVSAMTGAWELFGLVAAFAVLYVFDSMW